jgi:hypothetical protein
LFYATKGLTYGAVVDQFIEQYAKPGQHTWDQTQRVLKNNCADWLTKPIAEITDKDADTLLATFSADKHDYKAALTLRWLRTLWKWAWKKKYVPERVMDRVDFRYKERARDRWYADHEIKAIWNAANKLDPIESTYVKLLLLLAPRKTALAMMRRADLSEFDDKGNPTIWTTPHELTKTKATAKPRSYLTPLPLLAQRRIKGLPASDGGDGLMFPGLSVHHTKAGRAVLLTDSLRKRLVRHGAPRTSTSTPRVTRSRRGCGTRVDRTSRSG